MTQDEKDIKVVILAGGLGTRLAEETDVRPKPMVEIGGRPMLWHIMSIYSHYGFNNFVIALGYKAEYIKRYWSEYAQLSSNLTVNMRTGEVLMEEAQVLDWTVELVNTGLMTETASRVKRLAHRLGNKTFMLTYGDGVCDVNLNKLLAFHRAHGKLATITAVRPPGRFGVIEFDGHRITRFAEKAQTDVGWINGGFMVLEPGVLDYVHGDEMRWEKEPFEQLAAEGQLMAYQHDSFWQCMDTLRDKQHLETMWQKGNAPWAVWDRAQIR